LIPALALLKSVGRYSGRVPCRGLRPFVCGQDPKGSRPPSSKARCPWVLRGKGNGRAPGNGMRIPAHSRVLNAGVVKLATNTSGRLTRPSLGTNGALAYRRVSRPPILRLSAFRLDWAGVLFLDLPQTQLGPSLLRNPLGPGPSFAVAAALFRVYLLGEGGVFAPALRAPSPLALVGPRPHCPAPDPPSCTEGSAPSTRFPCG
jgi:hypothetical protein